MSTTCWVERVWWGCPWCGSRFMLRVLWLFKLSGRCIGVVSTHVRVDLHLWFGRHSGDPWHRRRDVTVCEYGKVMWGRHFFKCYDPFPACVWSIGCLAYVLFNGDCPFNTKKDIQEFESLQWKVDKKTLNSQGVNFIEMCLEMDPNRRIDLGSLIHHPWIKMYSWKYKTKV